MSCESVIVGGGIAGDVNHAIHQKPGAGAAPAWARSVLQRETGANDGARTRDIQDHNLALYQLSYVRHRGEAPEFPERGVYADAAGGVNADGVAAAPRVPKSFSSRASASSNTSSRLQKAKRAKWVGASGAS